MRQLKINELCEDGSLLNLTVNEVGDGAYYNFVVNNKFVLALELNQLIKILDWMEQK